MTKTLDQVVAMQAKAVRFMNDVVGDPHHADKIESLGPEEYAERKGVRIENPKSRRIGAEPMATRRPSRTELEERVEELEQENETLSEKIENILNIASEDDSDEALRSRA